MYLRNLSENENKATPFRDITCSSSSPFEKAMSVLSKNVKRRMTVQRKHACVENREAAKVCGKMSRLQRGLEGWITKVIKGLIMARKVVSWVLLLSGEGGG